MIYRYQMHENSQMECAPLHFVIQTHTKKKSCMSKTGCGFKWGGGGGTKPLQGKRAKDGLDKFTVASRTHLSPVVHLSQLVSVHSGCTVCAFTSIPPSISVPFFSFSSVTSFFCAFNSVYALSDINESKPIFSETRKNKKGNELITKPKKRNTSFFFFF